MPTSFLEYLRDFVPPNKQVLFDKKISDRTRFLSIVLEDIYQPQNASAVMRTCDCFGIQDLHIIEDRNDWEFYPVVERGSSKWLNISRYSGTKNNSIQCISKLKEDGYKIVVTTPYADHTLDDLPLDKPLALVLGNEMAGVSDAIVKESDFALKIPMVGFTESLNLSVAAGIFIHHITNRLKKEGVHWQLSEEDKYNVLETWCKSMVKHPEVYYKRYLESLKA